MRPISSTAHQHLTQIFRQPMAQTVKNLPAVQHVGSIPGLEDPLEKGMTNYSSILAWEILWMEKPDRLQSMGLQSWTRLMTNYNSVV